VLDGRKNLLGEDIAEGHYRIVVVVGGCSVVEEAAVARRRSRSNLYSTFIMWHLITAAPGNWEREERDRAGGSGGVNYPCGCEWRADCIGLV